MTAKEIPNYDGYFVDEAGNVYALRKLIPRPTKGGYERVALVDNEGNRKDYLVHRLVAEVFLPNEEDLPEVNHLDSCRNHNHVNNLEWCTRSDNVAYAYSNGRKSANGERNGRSRMTEETVKELRFLHKSGKFTYLQLMKRFNIPKSTVRNIVKRKTWKSI